MVADSEQILSSRNVFESDLEEEEAIKDIPENDSVISRQYIPEYDSSQNSSEDEESLSLSQDGPVISGSETCDSSSNIISNGTRSKSKQKTGAESTKIKDEESSHEIREVWAHNLVEEFRNICELITKFPFVAMDTEFPGVVAKPLGNFSTMDEYRYQQIKCNVDLLKLIQLGISLFDCSGNTPVGVCTWQFNFNFNLSEDLYAEDSISLLQSSGIEFAHHSTIGIEPQHFAELLISSGLVLMDNVTWLTFHSAYDFGYLLSQLTSQKLPETEAEFLDTLRIYFPHIYDIKFLMQATDNLIGGLQRVANRLKVKRIGIQHQAGSDSLLTGQVFFTMYTKYFAEKGLDDVKFSGQIFGFGNSGHEGVTHFEEVVVKDDFEDSVLCSEFEELNTSCTASPMRHH